MKIKLVGALLGIGLFGSLCVFGNRVYTLSTTDLVSAMTREDKEKTLKPVEVVDEVDITDDDEYVIIENDEKTQAGIDGDSRQNVENMINSIKVADLIAKANGDENIMFSPLSLNYALKMLREGASGESLRVLDKYLGNMDKAYDVSAMDTVNPIPEPIDTVNPIEDPIDTIQPVYEPVDTILPVIPEKYTVSNSIWVSKDQTINKDFAETMQNKYCANISEVDFENVAKAVKTINKWSKKSTDGMIPEIVTEDIIKKDTKVVLANSIFFQSAWKENWFYNEGYAEKFRLSDNSSVDISYMYSEAEGYYENDKAIAFSKEYENGLKFIGILPIEEGEFSLEELNIPELLDHEVSNVDIVNAKMPRLDFETSASLSDILMEMGMGNLFSDFATIDGITDEALKIDEVIQKTKLELDENGTRAAATTAIVMEECTGLPLAEPVIKEVYLDRPFAFLIYDEAENEIVFAGKIVDVE